jgi:hypothetical protein
MRLPDRVTCPHCSTDSVIKDGKDDTDPQRQGYFCQGCLRRFDDLTGSILAGHHESPQNWIICLYFIGLNLSSPQITAELDLDPDDVCAMVPGATPITRSATPEANTPGTTSAFGVAPPWNPS